MKWPKRLAYTRQTIEFVPLPEISLPQVIASLSRFKHFNNGANKWALCQTCLSDNGERFAFFDAQRFFGFLCDLVNPKCVPVRIWTKLDSAEVNGDTAGRHMLIGQRRWKAELRDGESLQIITEAYEAPRGIFNRIGMFLAGRKSQFGIWKAYLLNLLKQFGVRNESQTEPTEYIRKVHAKDCPWTPVMPYPGETVP